VLLSYVAEAISGKPFLQMIDEAVIAPLNLTRTFTHPTKEEYGVIPGTLEDTMWSTDLGNEAPYGSTSSPNLGYLVDTGFAAPETSSHPPQT